MRVLWKHRHLKRSFSCEKIAKWQYTERRYTWHVILFSNLTRRRHNISRDCHLSFVVGVLHNVIMCCVPPEIYERIICITYYSLNETIVVPLNTRFADSSRGRGRERSKWCRKIFHHAIIPYNPGNRTARFTRISKPTQSHCYCSRRGRAIECRRRSLEWKCDVNHRTIRHAGETAPTDDVRRYDKIYRHRCLLISLCVCNGITVNRERFTRRNWLPYYTTCSSERLCDP